MSASVISAEPELINAAVQRACRRVAPLWELHELVAVNPYLGHADTPLLSADARLRRCLGDGVLPSPGTLAEAWRSGRFAAQDVLAAAQELGLDQADAQALVAQLATSDSGPATADGAKVLGIAARLHGAGHGPWPDWIAADLGRFLAARHSQGIARFTTACTANLWQDWRRQALYDHSLAAHGVRGMHRFLAELPDDATAVRQACLIALGVGSDDLEEYATHLLGTLQGWAGALRRLGWTGDDIGPVTELLTILLVLEAALAALHHQSPAGLRRPQLPRDNRPTPALALLPMRAAELGFQRRFLTPLAARAENSASPVIRPDVHAVFCIDVRSEPFRRALEAVAPSITTVGFAGFFGVVGAIDDGLGIRAQCPVLLSPQHHARIAPPRSRRLTGQMLGFLRRSAGGGFTYMETAGFSAVVPLLRETLGLAQAATSGDADAGGNPEHRTPLDLAAMPMDQRIAVARSIVQHVHLEGVPGRLLLLCGHDSSSANNPQAAGLACGACGGHGGGSNARIAAAILNHPEIRAALGGIIPDDTVAVAGLHDTTLDQITILDRDAVPAGHVADLVRLEQALAQAGQLARVRRAPTIPGLAAGDPLAALVKRARDWAEPRPEWALAGCAAFIAAPRAWTRGYDLGGRAFLHSYDEANDAEHRTLELILTAPVVVASWIALQYHAAVVAPRRWSSGRKTIHNPVGMHGVMQGNDGDLAVGPAWESIHDGAAFRHDAVRLSVVVAAAPAAIDAILARHPTVAALFDHGWLLLSALRPGTMLHRRHAHSWNESCH